MGTFFFSKAKYVSGPFCL